MATIVRGIISVLFGNYPHGSDGTVQPIEWDVLKREGNKALLISKNVLTARRFDEKSNVWADSEIRRWLNNEFLNTAFKEEEKAAILYQELPDVGTTDNVFLLSDNEAESLYKSDAARCKDELWWWLRSPYSSSDHITGIVDYHGSLGIGSADNDHVGVSPALWVDLDSDIFKS